MFQLEKPTQVTCLHTNIRTELHGTEKVRAIDLAFCLTGENTLLDTIQPGLREHHYTNNAADVGQQSLPGELLPMPNLRFPRLPTEYTFAKGEKWRGYRWIWDWGTEEQHRDFTDAALSGLKYEVLEGGSCKVYFTVQYNGHELEDNDVYGELAGLPSMGEVHISLIAPPELIPARKGYRAGRPDTPQTGAGDSQTGDLLDQGGKAGGEGGDQQGGSNPATPLDALKKAHGVTADAE